MSEIYGGERSPEGGFLDQLGLVDAGEIDQATELIEVYLDALQEVLNIDKQQLIVGARLVDDLNADSLSILEVLEVLQEKRDIDLPIEAFEGVRTTEEAFNVFYKFAVEQGPDKGPEGDGPESGDRKPRSPAPSAPSGAAHLDLPN